MPTVTFLPSQKSVEVKKGTSLVEASRRAGIAIETPCGGEGTCGKCLALVLSGKLQSEDRGVLSEQELSCGQVLACSATVLDSDVTVEVSEHEEQASIESFEESHLRAFSESVEFDPPAKRTTIEVPGPSLEDGLSDWQRLKRSLDEKSLDISLCALSKLAEALRSEDGTVSVTLVRNGKGSRVIDVQPGASTKALFGIAVDVGTTTIAVQLVDLSDGKVVSSWTDYNEQVLCGLDVISRIHYARKQAGLEELTERVRSTINRLIKQARETACLAREDVPACVVSGNTTMMHLLLGLTPEHIRLEPYTPTFLEAMELSAGELGLDIHQQARVWVSPCVGSYVGGDITAGALVSDLGGKSEAISLFIDIGTNGELVIGNSEFLMTCACSAGPAFEGGGIEAGMRASRGAIERVRIDESTGAAQVVTIGGTKPKGICGSGMISLLANLFGAEWIDPAGKLERTRASDSICIDGRRASYVLVSEDESATGKEILINETDIENVLRAKAAVYSASSLMLEEIGIGFDDLSKVYIGGGFGRFLDLEEAITIGLLPDISRERFVYLGNSSLAGSYLVLVSQEYEKKQSELARRMTYIELNTSPKYMDEFTGAMFLPHTDESRFPSKRL